MGIIKLVTILIISSSVYSKTLSERIREIEKSGDIRLQMHLCGYRDANIYMFKRGLLKRNDIKKIACLESKGAEAKGIINNGKDRKNKIKQARVEIESFACSTLSGFNKNVCIIMGGK